MADDARLDELRGLLAEQMWRDDSGSDKPLSSTGPGTQRTYARAASNLLPIVSAWAEQLAARRAAEAWDEGHAVGWEHCQDGNYGNDYWDDDAPNPYRAALTPATEEKL